MLGKLIPLTAAAAAAGALAVWLGRKPTTDLTVRAPSRPSLPAATTFVPQTLPAWEGRLEQGDGTPAELPGSWPGFRGPNRDGISTESVALARSWPDGGPPVLWQRRLGHGHAGPAVKNGRVYVLDHDADAQADVLRCMSLADGKDIWRYSYPVKVRDNHGMSRTVPAVTDKYVVSLGPLCHVLCVDAKTGEHRWHLDLVRQFGTVVPRWHAGQCPLIDGDRAILAPAGPGGLMIAVDCATGEIVWTTPNPRNWGMTHSSIAATTVAGQRTYVYCTTKGVVGVSPDDGRLLWEAPQWRIGIANVPTPVPIGEGKVLLTGEYNAGAMMLGLRRDGGGFQAEPIFRLEHPVFSAHQHTPIHYNGHVYGVRQDNQLACLAPDGRLLWESGSDNTFGIGPYLIADGLILLLNANGVLTLADATPGGYRPRAQARVLPGPEAWGCMALAGGRLLLRDAHIMKCLDLRAK